MAERVAFDCSLYSTEAVEAAAEAYGELAKIEVTPSAEAVVVTLDDIADEDAQMIVHAFCNHALYETIARRRQSALDEVS